MDKLAPIVLFVYNRLDHTEQTIEALQKNDLAEESELYIYSDEAKNEEAQQKVDEVRKYIDNIEGFKKVIVIKREKNWGLANSIIDGVTKIVNEYGKVIVLEDDIVTSKYFLKFMNSALEFYKNEKKVWHVSGWNYPIKTNDLEAFFLWRVMNCWGWATWADRWQFFEKNINGLIDEFSQKDIERFNVDNYENFWNQVLLNKEDKINTWAIFWYATIFKQNGLCLNPNLSYVRNIGHDGSGVHCKDSCNVDNEILNISTIFDFSIKIEENDDIVCLIKKHLKNKKKSFPIRVINKLSRFTIRKNIIK